MSDDWKKIARLREENALLQMKVDNAENDIEQAGIHARATWRSKVEDAERRILKQKETIAEYGAQLNQLRFRAAKVIDVWARYRGRFIENMGDDNPRLEALTEALKELEEEMK